MALKVALDGMGGDRGPGTIVEGALMALASASPDLEVILVGRPDALEAEIERLQGASPRLTVRAASQVAGMADTPSQVLRRMPDSSIRVCFDLLKAGEADAVVSAGNSGATMAVGMVVMGRLPEVERPALASVFPTLTGPTVVIDVGANVDCTALMLLQFGYMGSVYAERVLNVANPRVGLLSIGEEGGKGNSVVKQAYELLSNSALNFQGNLEGRDMFTGESAVVVCDGFVGNVCLKLSEGLLDAYNQLVRSEVLGGLRGVAGAWLLKPSFKRLAQRMDYASHGGAPLLGIAGNAFICHGASSARAIASAVRVAGEAVDKHLTKHLTDGLARYRGALLGERETKEAATAHPGKSDTGE